jgi:hypothetical protein
MSIKVKMTPTRTPQKVSERQRQMSNARKHAAYVFKSENEGPTFVLLNYGRDVFEFPYPMLQKYGLGESDLVTEDWRPLSTVSPDRAAYRAREKAVEFRSDMGRTYWLWRSDLKRWVDGGDFPVMKDQPPMPRANSIMNAIIWQDTDALVHVGVDYGRVLADGGDDSSAMPILHPNAVMSARIWQDSNNSIREQIEYDEPMTDDFG